MPIADSNSSAIQSTQADPSPLPSEGGSAHASKAFQLQMLVASMAAFKDSVIITDGEFSGFTGPQIVFANAAAEQLTGCTSDELIGKTLEFVQGPQSQAAALNEIRIAFSQSQPLHVEMVYYNQAGREYWIDLNIAPIRADNGETNYFVLIQRDLTAHKQAELAMQENEWRWRFALEGAGDGLWDWDISRDTVFFSKRYKEMLGYDEEGFGNDSAAWSSRVHPDDLPAVMAALQRHFDNALVIYRSEFRALCKDGSYKWILARGMVIRRDSHGKPLRMSGTHSDITLRREAENALRAALETQIAILNALPAEIALLDADGRILTVNQNWGTFATQHDMATNDLVIGQKYLDVCDIAMRSGEKTAHAIADGLNSVLSGQQPDFRLEYPCCFVTEVRWFTLVIHPVSLARHAGIIVLHVDTTERKLAEQRLSDEQERLTGLINTAMDAIVTADKDHNIIGLNSAAEAMFGWSTSQVAGLPLTVLMPDRFASRHLSHLAKFGDTSECNRSMRVPGEVFGLRANGQEFPLEASISKVEVGGGRFYTAFLRDVTQRRQAEETLRRTNQEMRALARHLEVIRDEQAAHIARELHDEFGQTLTVLKLHIYSLQKKIESYTNEPSSFDAREAIGLIDSSISSLRRICTELRPPMLDHLGLSAALGKLASDFQKKSGITCSLDAIADFPLLDPPCQTTVYRLVQELLTNVARHSGASSVRIVLRVSENTLELIVSDNGRGISKAEIQGKQSFGLLGIRERILAAGGTISLEGHPNLGTTACARLPIDLKLKT